MGKITHSYFGKRDGAHAEALLSYAEYGPWVNRFTAEDWELWRAHQRRLPAGVARAQEPDADDSVAANDAAADDSDSGMEHQRSQHGAPMEERSGGSN